VLANFNVAACLLIAAMCVWSEVSKHTNNSFWLTCARAALAITSLVEGSWYSNDLSIVVAQVLMNGAVAFLLVVVFCSVQVEAVRQQYQSFGRPTMKDYLTQFVLFWRW